MMVRHGSSQERIYLETSDAMAAPKVFVKKINERLSQSDKIHLSVYKDWDKNFGSAETTFVESTRIAVGIFETSIDDSMGPFESDQEDCCVS